MKLSLPSQSLCCLHADNSSIKTVKKQNITNSTNFINLLKTFTKNNHFVLLLFFLLVEI